MKIICCYWKILILIIEFWNLIQDNFISFKNFELRQEILNSLGNSEQIFTRIYFYYEIVKLQDFIRNAEFYWKILKIVLAKFWAARKIISSIKKYIYFIEKIYFHEVEKSYFIENISPGKQSRWKIFRLRNKFISIGKLKMDLVLYEKLRKCIFIKIFMGTFHQRNFARKILNCVKIYFTKFYFYYKILSSENLFPLENVEFRLDFLSH